MSIPTAGELFFEEFCRTHDISCTKVEEGTERRPDYKVILSEVTVYVEVKDIEEDEDFRGPVRTRTVGSHVRAKIHEARTQLQPAARAGSPTLLLIYNRLDPYYSFGTEQHDFIDAMYGERTLSIDLDSKEIVDSFQGRNNSLACDRNTSFSAVGRIRAANGSISIVIYENIFARNPLNFSALPSCIDAKRVVLDESCHA